MALIAKSLFLYNFQVTENNRSLDFKSVSGGPEKQATLTVGFYSLTSLGIEVVTQLQAADPLNIYTFTVDRTVAGGTEVRVTISTSGTFLSLLFSSGSRAASTCAYLLGYTATDKTGFLTYTSQSTAGTSLVPNLAGYNFIPPELYRNVQGSLNISTSGIKEAIVFSVMKFFQVQFKHIPKSIATTSWTSLMTWAMQQREFEFTPEISSPSTFYRCTLETTSADGKALGFKITEEIPQFPNLYDTGLMKFRIKE